VSPPSPVQVPTQPIFNFGDEELNTFFKTLPLGSQRQINSLPPKDRITIFKKIMEKKKGSESILSVPEEKKEKQEEDEEDKTKEEKLNNSSSKSGGSGATKSVSFDVSTTISGDTKKIIL
jgi:hypothetical protein